MGFGASCLRWLLLFAMIFPTMGRLVRADELSADELVRRVNERDVGHFAVSRVTMDLIDKGGSTRTRVARFYRMVDGPDRKLAVFYESPRTIQDTAFLVFDYGEAGRDDDQWLYLPALRRTRRIAAADRGNAFLGTDLSYEEVKKEARIATEDYRFELSGSDEADGHACRLVEATPVDERVASELGYSRVEYCIDPEIWMVRRARYWNRAERLLKTVDVLEISPVDGIQTSHLIDVHNHENGHRTVFRFDEMSYPSQLDVEIFTERRLRQGAG